MATDGLRRSVGSAVDVTLQLAALADAGNEYLILQPSEAPDPFTIAPAPGAYAVEWHSLASGETVSGPGLTVSDTKITISTPPGIAGPAVLHLRRS
jgi:hypothetical protein